MAKRVTRIPGAYDEEAYYSTTPVTSISGVVRLNAHKLLDYARARLEVARFLAADFRKQPQTGVVGFLTGSIGLLATARELLEPLHPGRFKLVMGLSHAGGSDAAVAELCEVLDELRGNGVRRIVLVDEIKSGTQMTTGLQAVIRWVGTRSAADIEISALGVAGAPPKGQVRPPSVAELVTKSSMGQRVRDPRTVTTTSLLEMDTDGLKLRGVKRTGVGEYDFCREQPDRGLSIYCPDGGPNGGAGVRSLDTAFAGTVNRILGLSRPAEGAVAFDVGDGRTSEPQPQLLTWPDTISRGTCETCRRLLAIARVVATARHQWTSVAAYYLSEHDHHPPNRELDYWLAAEKHVREESKLLGIPPWLR